MSLSSSFLQRLFPLAHVFSRTLCVYSLSLPSLADRHPSRGLYKTSLERLSFSIESCRVLSLLQSSHSIKAWRVFYVRAFRSIEKFLGANSLHCIVHSIFLPDKIESAI